MKTNPEKPQKKRLSATIDQRRVVLVTGTKTQTLNVDRPASDSKTGYETKIRMSDRFVTESEFADFENLSLETLTTELQGPPWNGEVEFTDYAAWSDYWLNLRKKMDVAKVFKQWKALKPKPSGWLRLKQQHGWKGDLYTYRHDNLGKPGEKKIEELLFPKGKEAKRTEGKSIEIQLNGKKIGRLTATYHQPPLANQSKGQRKPDLAAMVELDFEKKKFPAMVEVKVSDNNPWYALIECLQQVHMARSYPDLKSICPGTKEKGVWGVVLAPKKYFENKKYEKHMEACMELLNRFKAEKTHARIAFASSDKLEKGIIQLLPQHNWSTGRSKR